MKLTRAEVQKRIAESMPVSKTDVCMCVRRGE